MILGMDLLGAAGNALGQMFTLQYLLYILLGVTLGNLVGILPGIGGNLALTIMIPFMFWMDPILAIGFLEGMHAATATGGAITSILVNVPGESSNAATCFDGYPMTRRGEGGRAVGASAMASGIGGLIGALALFCLLPIVRPLVLAMGPPEVFALVLVGLTMIAYVGEGSTLKALLAGLLGLLLSFVGNDPATGMQRFTFGQLYLFDKLDVIPVLIGIFGFATMLGLIKDKKGIVDYAIQKASFAQVWEGCLDCFRHWGLLVRSSLLGTLVGLVPGLGGAVASFVAYGHAVQSSKKGAPFGTGRIEGVIAPEAANNSKEGGNLVPTIAFGIPSNASMAIILGALTILGLTPGPKMLKEELPMTLVVVWTLALGNMLAAAQIILFANPLAKLAAVRASIIVPSVLAVAALGAYSSTNSFSGVAIAGIFGIVGYQMIRHDFSRATLIIGLVLGRIAERNYNLSMLLFGPGFVFRPVTLAILFLVAVVLILLTVKGFVKKKGEDEE
jgi:putative tricarboxylic transport membrane protein